MQLYKCIIKNKIIIHAYIYSMSKIIQIFLYLQNLISTYKQPFKGIFTFLLNELIISFLYSISVSSYKIASFTLIASVSPIKSSPNKKLLLYNSHLTTGIDYKKYI